MCPSREVNSLDFVRSLPTDRQPVKIGVNAFNDEPGRQISSSNQSGRGVALPKTYIEHHVATDSNPTRKMRLVVQLTFALAVTWPAAAQSSLTPNTLRLDDPHDSRR